jgi:hypothetical protein
VAVLGQPARKALAHQAKTDKSDRAHVPRLPISDRVVPLLVSHARDSLDDGPAQ